jgi:hypothetical protein
MNKLTPEEIAELRKKENKNVLKNYRITQGDTTARTTKPSIPISTGGRGKLITFPIREGAESTEPTTADTMSGNQGEVPVTDEELGK